MKYLKTYENLPELLKLNLGKFISIQAYKSDKMETSRPDYDDTDYCYFAKSKSIEIFINDKFAGELRIDERRFNTLDKIQNVSSKSPPYIFFTKKIQTYLLKCHEKMKKSNSGYGTYDHSNITKSGYYEGKIPLLVHHFFDFVKKDYKSNSPDAKILKDSLKNLELQLDAEKYNL